MWNERYAAEGFAYGTEPNDFLRDVAEQLAPRSRVLCLAEGEGRNAVFLATLGHSVVAVDQSDVGLKKAEALAQRKGVVVQTVVADLNDFVIEPGAYDAIVSIWAHVPPPLRTRLHAACVSGLAPRGLFVLEAYTPAQTKRTTGGPREPQVCMSADGLRRELSGLEIVLLHERVRMVHEGAFHDGESDVVQLLARRTA